MKKIISYLFVLRYFSFQHAQKVIYQMNLMSMMTKKNIHI